MASFDSKQHKLFVYYKDDNPEGSSERKLLSSTILIFSNNIQVCPGTVWTAITDGESLLQSVQSHPQYWFDTLFNHILNLQQIVKNSIILRKRYDELHTEYYVMEERLQIVTTGSFETHNTE